MDFLAAMRYNFVQTFDRTGVRPTSPSIQGHLTGVAEEEP